MKTELAAKMVAAAVLGGLTPAAWGSGFRLASQDAFASARGEAFVATADNPSAIYYNPAGLTQMEGQNIRGGVYGLYTDLDYKSPTTGRSFDNEKDLHAIPQLFYSMTLESVPIALGLGGYSAYGLSSKWPQDTGFRTLATRGSVISYTINPTAAWQILPSLSLGAGLRVTYADVDLERGLVWPSQAFDNFGFRGNGWGVSYDVGVLWKPIEQVSLGAVYKSTTTIDLRGHTEYYNTTAFPPGVGAVPAFPTQRVDAHSRMELPFNVVCGLSYRPVTNWNFEFDADYTDWSSVGTLTINQARGFDGLIPQSVPLALNWQPSWYYEWGATRYLENGWSVSAGFIYNQNSVPSATYTPLVGDLDRYFITIGTGHKGRHFSFDVAYQFGFGPARTVTGSTPSATGQTADGKYEFISHAVSATAGWHF